MANDYQETLRSLRSASEIYDREWMRDLCGRFVAELRGSDALCPERPAVQVLQLLRNHRHFGLIDNVAEMLMLTGQLSPPVRRQYAQALIEQGKLTASISVLLELVRDADCRLNERVEAKGLLGRAHKERYLQAAPGGAHARRHLEAALYWYYQAYVENPAANFWPGINVVAMLARGERDGLSVTGYLSYRKLAGQIRDAIQRRFDDYEADMWDMATCGEACVALGDADAAVTWYSRYVREPYAEAFELASTRRQLVEVWQLSDTDPIGGELLPILKSRELSEPGSLLTVEREAFRAWGDVPYHSGRLRLEKLFGRSATHEMEWVLKGCDRTRSVARLGFGATRGVGTGFLVRGSDLHAEFGDELVLLTNAHVLSNDESVGPALRPDEVTVIFETNEFAGGGQEFQVKEILWTSPPRELDTTIARLEQSVRVLEPIPISPYLPRIQEGRRKERVYILGHPGGGTLAWSIQDNVLLDYAEPRLHYRAPTEGGSSGSPIFDKQWRLIGIHHAGLDAMPTLKDPKVPYEANEGIMIRSIQQRLAAG